MKRIFFIVALCLLAQTSFAQEKKVDFGTEHNAAPLIAQEEKNRGIGWGLVPALAYDSNTGFGFGVAGTVYKRDPKLKPYHFGFDGQIFLTTENYHSHYIRGDWLNAFGLPLRLRLRLGFLAIRTENYCGQGAAADCYQIASAGTQGNDYQHLRYMEPNGNLEGRWMLGDKPHRKEIIFSWRGSYYISGDFYQSGPFLPSRYANDFGANGTNGFASVLEAGVMFDNRDTEAAPREGYWVEATVREASTLWGSQWNYLGFNMSLRGYLPLEPGKRLVLAGQGIFDGIVGNPPLEELVRVGGSLQQQAFGGNQIGRGLRSLYFPGGVKLIKQLELRYMFVGFDILTEHFDIGAVAFTDAALIAWNLSHFGQDPFNLMLGFGGGLRVVWSENFVIRFDVGVSPTERYRPQFYLKIGNVF